MNVIVKKPKLNLPGIIQWKLCINPKLLAKKLMMAQIEWLKGWEVSSFKIIVGRMSSKPAPAFQKHRL